MNEIIEKENKIENMIYEIRGVEVMLDSDLAKLYECVNGTKTINQAVKRHLNKFPERYMFQLDKNEYVSFLYAIYYGVYGNNKYKWNSGFIISQILEGQLRVEDSIKMFVYLTK